MKWKNLHMPRHVEFAEGTMADGYGRFVLQPLERGFGVTLGNALRRVLLSSIQGAAIRSVRFDDVYHEFSTIPGVVEDVPQIVLNLKQVRLRLHADEDRTVRIEKMGKGEWIAGDLNVDPEVEVVNPELHIATLDQDAAIRAEILIGDGRGYVTADENKIPDQSIGTINTDSIFSPIRKVHYEVENARVGRRTDYDKLTMEVWTDKTVRPDDAVSYAAKILKDHLQLFISFEVEPEDEEQEEVDEEKERIGRILKMSVEELELSVRSSNCLRAAGIARIEDLVQKTESEMLKYRNFGRKSLNELSAILADLGLYFGMDLVPYAGEGEAKSGLQSLPEGLERELARRRKRSKKAELVEARSVGGTQKGKAEQVTVEEPGSEPAPEKDGADTPTE
jgi:DNA-directed RNA polymerase subunit alpha